MTKITLNGTEFDIDAVVNLMDDEVREEVHSFHLLDDQEFVDAYARLHEEKFGEPFVVN